MERRFFFLLILLRAHLSVWTYDLKLVYFPHRAYTAVELRKKLHGKRFPPDIVEAVIGDFESRCMADFILWSFIFRLSYVFPYSCYTFNI
jgi:hypothetical protein